LDYKEFERFKGFDNTYKLVKYYSIAYQKGDLDLNQFTVEEFQLLAQLTEGFIKKLEFRLFSAQEFLNSLSFIDSTGLSIADLSLKEPSSDSIEVE